MIISKCPLRVSLVGGSTDLQGFIDEYGYGSVISFPIDLYTYITLTPNIYSNKYRIDYSTPEEVEDPNQIKNDIAREVIKYFNLPPLIMSFNSDIPSSGSGLASSSSYLLACILAACKFKDIEISQSNICKLAVELERKFNPLTGYQDAYGCGVGSLKQYIFYKDKIITEFLSSDVIKNHKLYLVPTNLKPRLSTDILKTIDYSKSFKLLDLVKQLKNNLNNPVEFFNIFNEGWENKKLSSSHIMTEELIIQEKYLLNTYKIKGIKLLGAGGGGYFLIITNDNVKEGKQIKIDNLGVQVWKI
jgi:D-glycero-alpha-D-manno-heptose-7-phosphate kinase